MFEVLEHCDRDALLSREQHWMDLYKSYNRDVGYNMSSSSQYPQYEYTDEIRKKISDRVRQALANLGPEARARMVHAARFGQKALGPRHSGEFKKRQSERLKIKESEKVIRSDGVVFESMNAAAVFHGVERHTISKWCKGRPIKNLKWRHFTFKKEG